MSEEYLTDLDPLDQERATDMLDRPLYAQIDEASSLTGLPSPAINQENASSQGRHISVAFRALM